MNLLRLAARLLGVAAVIFWGVAQMVLWFSHESPSQKRQRIQRWARQVLCVCGLSVRAENLKPLLTTHGKMLVANHISWLDIIVIDALCPVRFVAKQEVRAWPILGWLAARAGTIFIERGNRQSAQNVAAAMQEKLEFGDTVMFFPEGTSTNGSILQPFKKSLFQAACEVNTLLYPVVIYYPDATGAPDEALAYYGDISLWQSFCRILPKRHKRAEVYVLTPITTKGQNRQVLAEHAQKQIAAKLTQLQNKQLDEILPQA